MTEKAVISLDSPAKYADKPHWWKLLLNKAKKNPKAILRDRRCDRPDFFDAFLDVCDGKALEEPDQVLDYASAAVDLARGIDDPHLLNRARGVLVHAHISREEWRKAESALSDYDYENEATGCCCPTCQGDYHRRRADLLIETHKVGAAVDDLVRVLEELGDTLDEDMKARVRFLRGITHHYQGDPGRALDDAGKALLELALESPRGYFLDALAFIACFLIGADASHNAKAMDYLERFTDRINGHRDRTWAAVRTRLAWVKGGVHARLGNERRARDQLAIARPAIKKSAPPKHYAAIVLDEMQLLARRPSDTHLESMRRLISLCLLDIKLDDKKLRRKLEKLEGILVSTPEKAPAAVAKTRAAFLTPVPGLVY